MIPISNYKKLRDFPGSYNAGAAGSNPWKMQKIGKRKNKKPMKCTFTENFKKVWTIEELEQAKSLKKDLSADGNKPEFYASLLLSEFNKKNDSLTCEILKTTVVIGKAGYNYLSAYGDDFGYMNAFVETTAKIFHVGEFKFVEVSTWITDIFQIGAVDVSDKIYSKIYG